MVKRSPLRLRPERGFLRSQRESWNSRKNRINGQEGRRIEPEGKFHRGEKGARQGPENGPYGGRKPEQLRRENQYPK